MNSCKSSRARLLAKLTLNKKKVPSGLGDRLLYRNLLLSFLKTLRPFLAIFLRTCRAFLLTSRAFLMIFLMTFFTLGTTLLRFAPTAWHRTLTVLQLHLRAQWPPLLR